MNREVLHRLRGGNDYLESIANGVVVALTFFFQIREVLKRVPNFEFLIQHISLWEHEIRNQLLTHSEGSMCERWQETHKN